jgi:undecaprenyl diphosphate synthase
MDVHHLVVYAFSTENWNRSKEEVGYLMDLMRVLLHERLDAPHKPDEAIHIVGDHARFPQDIQDLISKLHSRNVPTAAFHFWVCASYGGKSEILSAVHALLAQQKNTVTEEEFTSALWTARMPNPDIIIRTGGEKRLSNFLLWRSGYSELFFLDTYWPDFSKEELETVIAEFAGRKRNYGK